MEEHIVLYHGADVDSALDILNNGLDAEHLLALQTGQPVQIRTGWYTALDSKVAWLLPRLSCYVIPSERSESRNLHLQWQM